MSDIKHLEYCVKLGNTIVQNKLFELQQNGFVQPENNYEQIPKEPEMSFRERLKNW